jgi:hypothetical protein
MTAPKQPMIIGVFEDRAAVAQAMNALLKAGFQENQLGFAARQEHIDMLRQQEESKAKTSSSGVIVRGIVGGIMGAIDLLLVPITGPSDASNILATTLPATEEIIDRVTHSGGFLGTFTNIGVPKGKIKYYEQEVKASRTLVTVHTVDRQPEAIEILRHYGVHDIEIYSHHEP